MPFGLPPLRDQAERGERGIQPWQCRVGVVMHECTERQGADAATAKVVLANRSQPPDAILRVVHERSGDKPFERIEDLVSRDELAAITASYKQVAGVRR